MLNYNTLKDRPRDFLSATGLTLAEFEQLLQAFQAAYEKKYPSDRTREGHARQRRIGGGTTGKLQSWGDTLLFIVVYQTTNPLHTMHALHFDLSPAQAHYWIHHVLPVLQHALADLGMAPEREAHDVATSPLTWEGAPSLAVDGTERRRQRPTEVAKHKEHYSGKKKTHTDKNLLLVNAHTSKVVYLGPTIAGKMHDKKAADEDHIASPANATLDKDTGFQGYEPAGVLTQQPKKNPKAKHGAWAITSSITSFPVRAWWWKM